MGSITNDKASAKISFYIFVFFVLPVTLLVGIGSWLFHHVDFRMGPDKSACRAGDKAACVRVGEAYIVRGKGPFKDDGVAQEYLNRACDLQDFHACYRLGWLYTHTDDEYWSNEKALTALDRACKGGVPEGCNDLGKAYDDGVEMSDFRLAEDDRKAAALFEVACAADIAESCYRLAGDLVIGKGVAHDQLRAQALINKACQGGFDEACKSKLLRK